MKKAIALFLSIIGMFSILAACDNSSEPPKIDLLQTTKIDVLHYLSGQEESRTINDNADIDSFAEWLNNLTLELKQFTEGNSPGDSDGGEVYMFTLDSDEFSYIKNGADECYILYKNNWYQVKNPKDPFSKSPVQKESQWDRKPMVMIEDSVYMDTNREVLVEVDDTDIIGTIISSVDGSELPIENAQSNFGCEGSEFAYYENGIIVKVNGKWIFFENETQADSYLSVNESEKPDNFSFAIDFGIYGKNNIDSYNNTFTKDLVTAGRETIDFTIPTDKMTEIYQAFIMNRIAELPDDINAEVENIIGKSYTSWEPSNRYSVTYTCNNETRTIVCEDGGPWYAESGPPDSRNRLVAFVTLITEYIYSTDEYKKMPPAEDAYE